MIFNMFGIKVIIENSFWLYVVLLLSLSVVLNPSIAGLASGIWYIMVAFLSIMGHEYSHAIMARKFGYDTIKIVVHALGAGAYIARHNVPYEDICISIAGPAFNLFIVIITLPFHIALLYLVVLQPWLLVFLNMTSSMLIINVILTAFNMLPIKPLDGGRILESSLIYFKK